MHNKKFNQNLLFLGVVAAIAAGSHSVMAQQAVEEEIIVSGSYRESLAQALDIKRNSTTQVDAIVAEDIGKFPDMNLAESMQRIAGVSIDREGGEGRQISIRGLGSDFTRVRGMVWRRCLPPGKVPMGPTAAVVLTLILLPLNYSAR